MALKALRVERKGVEPSTSALRTHENANVSENPAGVTTSSNLVCTNVCTNVSEIDSVQYGQSTNRMSDMKFLTEALLNLPAEDRLKLITNVLSRSCNAN